LSITLPNTTHHPSFRATSGACAHHHYPSNHPGPPPSLETRDGGVFQPPDPLEKRDGGSSPSQPPPSPSLAQSARRRGDHFPSNHLQPAPSPETRDGGVLQVPTTLIPLKRETEGRLLPNHLHSPPSLKAQDGGGTIFLPTTSNPLPHSKRETEGPVSFQPHPHPPPSLKMQDGGGWFNPPHFF